MYLTIYSLVGVGTTTMAGAETVGVEEIKHPAAGYNLPDNKTMVVQVIRPIILVLSHFGESNKITSS